MEEHENEPAVIAATLLLTELKTLSASCLSDDEFNWMNEISNGFNDRPRSYRSAPRIPLRMHQIYAGIINAALVRRQKNSKQRAWDIFEHFIAAPISRMADLLNDVTVEGLVRAVESQRKAEEMECLEVEQQNVDGREEADQAVTSWDFHSIIVENNRMEEMLNKISDKLEELENARQSDVIASRAWQDKVEKLLFPEDSDGGKLVNPADFPHEPLKSIVEPTSQYSKCRSLLEKGCSLAEYNK